MSKSDEFQKPDIKLGKYQHYKGTFYQVIDVACHSETHDWYVVYRHLEHEEGIPETWVRPYHMFFEVVTHEGRTVPRFHHIQE